LAAVVYREIENEKITLSALSDRIGRSQGAMSQLLGRGLRAAPDTMSVISRKWKTPGAGARVMIAHLQDELFRAGWPVHDYRIEHNDGTGEIVHSKLDADLKDLRAAAEYVPALACLVADVLAVARAELPADLFAGGKVIGPALAAESKTKYGKGHNENIHNNTLSSHSSVLKL
jgi:hypothetical protein